jgi:hypothetical protein
MEFIFPHKTITLNEEQATAVQRPPMIHQRIIASAGSGKTTTLTARIAWLISEYDVDPKSIVLMTFSRNAATQMLQRIEDLIGKVDVWSGTFHGLSRSLLSKYGREALDSLYFVDELVGMGTKWLLSPRGKKWVEKLRYIFVDEFQDINESQWIMIQAMLHPGARLIVVGDDAQNIYTWRGSNVDYILRLETTLKNLVDDQLRINYRSSEAIIRCANSVMQFIPTLPWKKLMQGSGLRKGQPPEVRFFWRMCDESSWVVKTIEEILEQNGLATIAVLSRTNMDLYRIEEELLTRAIPYSIRETPKATSPDADPIERVHLSTLHASKGLEWDYVFLLHCNDEVFPASKKKEEIICERRLFYVAITRARKHLFFSYVKNERDLSRFIREIPNKCLLFHGLAKYCLSDAELTEGTPSFDSVVSSLDGSDYEQLRACGALGWLDSGKIEKGCIFPKGESWYPPAWTRRADHVREFYGFLRTWTKRFILQTFQEEFRDPLAERMLFTLRVFAEDKAFWLEWKDELHSLLYTFYNGEESLKVPPPIDYATIQQWARKRGLEWTSREILSATSFLSKIRAQLRPLRFETYDLHEFTINSARFVVPSEWRAIVYRSWKKICAMKTPNHELLEDIWRVATLEHVVLGRNAPLYRVGEMKSHFQEADFVEYLSTMETYMRLWMNHWDTTTEVSFEIGKEGYRPEVIDFFCQNTFWQISPDEKSISQSFLVLALAAGIAQEMGFPVRYVGIFNPLEGTWQRLPLSATWIHQYSLVFSLAR